MKAHMALIIVIALVANGVDGAPPAPTVSIPGGTMAPGPVGGQMSSAAVGGMLNPADFLGGALGSLTFSSGPPGGFLFGLPSLTANGVVEPPVGTISAGRVPAATNGVIVAGGANSLPAGTIIRSGLGGPYGPVIVAGGNANSLSGGTINRSSAGGLYGPVIVAGGASANSPGGTLTNATFSGSAHSVIVAGGSTP